MSTVRRPPCPSRHRQSGVAAMLILFVIAVVAISFLVSALKSSSSQTERDKITAAALAQAKAALIGYAASVDLYPPPDGCMSSTTCPRPGDLPCPDTNDDGQAESSCGNAAGTTGQVTRLGRLPWKTLGLPDLRDGYGERLWYAVSNSFKKSARAFPLNSDTLGTISVRDSNGGLFADATSSTGMTAVVISPGVAFTRQDGVVQDRSPAGNNNPINYLDVANGEDNKNFVDGSGNGFIQGPIKNASNSIILNDTLITISRDDIMRAVEKRVAAEVTKALPASFPNPAAFSDPNCLGFAKIRSTDCKSTSTANRGRIPANPSPSWSSNAVILDGDPDKHWFQQNAWREVIYYTTGSLTVNDPPSAITGRQVLIIMTGAVLGSQTRNSDPDKGAETNYLEEENLSPLDDLYTIRPGITTTPFNDKVRCLPASPPLC